MLLLLDENLPKGLRVDFASHDVFTIREKGWFGLKNGILLQKLIENKFDALITYDKNLQHQQIFLSIQLQYLYWVQELTGIPF